MGPQPIKVSSKAADQDSPDVSDANTADGSLQSALLQLVSSKSLLSVAARACGTARDLLGADSAAIVLREDKQYVSEGEDSRSALSKSHRSQADRSIGAWVIDHPEQPLMVPDIRTDSRILLDSYRKTRIRSLIMIPIGGEDAIGAIGVFWARVQPLDPGLMIQLRVIADFAAFAIENLRRGTELAERLREAESELETTQRKLGKEIYQRNQLEATVGHLHQTDPLTGLNNLLGFLSRARQLFKLVNRIPAHAWIIYIQLEGLHEINCSLGDATSDRIILDAARLLCKSFRESDVLARVRDHEFIAFVTAASDPLPGIEARLASNIDSLNRCNPDIPPVTLAIGGVKCDPRGQTSLEDLIHQADAAMYLSKRKKGLKAVESQAL